MKIELHINNRRPWRINIAPPRDRFFELMYKGTRLIAVYLPRQECWTIGTNTRIERAEITHWRECAPEQLEAFNHTLTSK